MLKPRFINEPSVRAYLQSLYTTIIESHDNARALANNEIDALDPKLARGNEIARKCFAHTIRWLRMMHEFSLSDDVFHTQFMDPARIAAKYKISMSTTTNLIGLVLTKSPEFYHPYFSDKVSDISIIVPSLESSLSLRCRSNYVDNVSCEVYEIGSVQPIPYVNRFHPVRVFFRECNVKFSLSELDFLKTSIYDIHKLSRSISFENFCQIHSSQLGRRALGSTKVISGRVVSIAVPKITIKPFFGGRGSAGVDLILTPQALSRLRAGTEKIVSLEGKTVRMLAVTWYDLHPVYPEVFLIEPAEENTGLLEDEIIGFVRLRQKVGQEVLQHFYPEVALSQLETPKLKWDGQFFSWSVDMSSLDDIVAGFLKQKLSLMNLRGEMQNLGGEGSLIPWAKVMDSEKLRLRTLVNKLRSNRPLTSPIMMIIKNRENGVAPPKSFRELALASPNNSLLLDDILWLRYVGFIKKTGEGIVVTKNGVLMAYLANRTTVMNLLKKKLEEKGPLVVPDIRSFSGFPNSFILKGLRELRDKGVHPLHVDGKPFELIWVKEGDDEAVNHAHEIRTKMETEVLSILRSVPHAMSILKICENFNTRLNIPDLEIILERLRIKGKIKKLQDMWIYPVGSRILDVLSENQDRCFGIKELMTRSGVPPAEEQTVILELNSLKKNGVVVEILPGCWAIQTNDPNVLSRRTEKLIKAECRNYVLTLLRIHKHLDLLTVKAKMRIHMTSLSHEKFSDFRIEVDKLVDEIINELLSEDVVQMHENVLSITMGKTAR